MAKKCGEGRNRSYQQLPQASVVAAGEQQMLAQQGKFLAQFIFHLHAMQVRGNREILHNIIAKHNSMVLLHIQKLYGENIGGAPQFFARDEQRRRLLLRIPPLHGWGKRLQGGIGTVSNHAKQIEVGEFRMEVSRDRRSKEDDALQVCSSRSPQPIDEVVDQFFRNHLHPRSLPTAACAPTAGTSATESTEATAASAKTAPAKTAAPVSTATAEHSREKHPEKHAAQGRKQDYEYD